ncbi:MAG: hypothetical protein JXA09_03905, partial [Anaerolineae bacterium]|nr:hypothetical protein [Anaerolineae bacterium]
GQDPDDESQAYLGLRLAPVGPDWHFGREELERLPRRDGQGRRFEFTWPWDDLDDGWLGSLWERLESL